MSRPRPPKPNEDTPFQCVPQGQYRRWAGRQWKTLKEQSDRYGFPFGETVDLTKFIGWFHDFLSENARKLNARPSQAERSSPALEKWRRERARLAELDRLQREGELVPFVMIVEIHNLQAELLRRSIERLEKRYDADAAQLVRDALDDLERLGRERFGDNPSDTDQTD